MRCCAVRIGSRLGRLPRGRKALRCGHRAGTFDAQVFASLLVSAVMLGVKVTSLNGIIRTISRRRELKMLVAELAIPRSRGSNIPAELMQHVRRATEHGPAEINVVCVLRSEPIGYSGDRVGESCSCRCHQPSACTRALPSREIARAFIARLRSDLRAG